MKRLILSRKGFDAKAGGVASPILRDGRIYSLPIPQDHPSPAKYRDLKFDEISGADLLNGTSASISPDSFCHLDPLLNKKIGIFGQASSSQTELKNNAIGSGDLFLFFGWFRDYFNKGKNLHHLFGWLEVERVIEGSRNIKHFLKQEKVEHPHGHGDVSRYTNNTIYICKKKLSLNTSINGHGLFKYSHKDLILTEDNMTRSRWKLPKEYFSNSHNLFLNRLKWVDEKNCRIFYRGFGQEFILNVEDNPKVIEWAARLIQKHS